MVINGYRWLWVVIGGYTWLCGWLYSVMPGYRGL